MTFRDKVIKYIKKKYGRDPEFLWKYFPETAVFRHEDNRKWFGLISSISREKLGLFPDGEHVDIFNVKLEDPNLVDILTGQEGYFKGYHMQKRNWVSILLDGTVPFEDICGMIDDSFKTTASKQKKQKLRSPKEWIIPANPKYYDIESAFDAADIIDWKQGAGIKTGDTVYIYVAAPVSAILYQCKVLETDIPYHYADENLTISALMKVKLLKRYRPDMFPFEILKEEYGIYAVRGPRGITNSLSEALKR